MSPTGLKSRLKSGPWARSGQTFWGQADRAGFSTARAKNWTTFNYEAEEKKSCSAMVLDDVSNALLCRRLCAHVPLHRLRVAFDDCHWWNEHHVNQWLSYVLRHSSQELHLDLRF
ncbi:F-box/LRR-repeat protein [Hordeum vulgare]|nr:F-box/LRR-repeat protein [Hordeum vulgare]